MRSSLIQSLSSLAQACELIAELIAQLDHNVGAHIANVGFSQKGDVVCTKGGLDSMLLYRLGRAPLRTKYKCCRRRIGFIRNALVA